MDHFVKSMSLVIGLLERHLKPLQEELDSKLRTVRNHIAKESDQELCFWLDVLEELEPSFKSDRTDRMRMKESIEKNYEEYYGWEVRKFIVEIEKYEVALEGLRGDY